MANGVVTLGNLRDQLRLRIDRVNSNFFTDSELNTYLNDSYKELYDILIQKFGDDYYVAAPVSITTDGTNDTYALASDFYKLLGVDISFNTGNANTWVTLKQFMFGERNFYKLPNVQGLYGLTNLRYRLRDNKLWFVPVPQASQSLRYFYIPRPTELDDDADTVDGVSGWEEYIICDAAIKCMVKEESDPMAFAAQKQAMLTRIESAAENRNAGEPQRVTDVMQDFWPYGGGGPGSSY